MEQLIQKLRDAGISFQITYDIGKEATVHAFDKNRKLHKTDGITDLIALKKMVEKLL